MMTSSSGRVLIFGEAAAVEEMEPAMITSVMVLACGALLVAYATPTNESTTTTGIIYFDPSVLHLLPRRGPGAVPPQLNDLHCIHFLWILRHGYSKLGQHRIATV